MGYLSKPNIYWSTELDKAYLSMLASIAMRPFVSSSKGCGNSYGPQQVEESKHYCHPKEKNTPHNSPPTKRKTKKPLSSLDPSPAIL